MEKRVPLARDKLAPEEVAVGPDAALVVPKELFWSRSALLLVGLTVN